MSEKRKMNIFEALSCVKNELDAIEKEKETTGNGPRFKFRGIDDIYNGTHELFGKYKIFSTTKIVDCNETQQRSKNGTLGTRVIKNFIFKFFTEDGSSIETESTGECVDWGDKAHNKAHSIAHKYAIMTLLCIPTANMHDPDEDNNDHNIKDPENEPKKAKKQNKKTNNDASVKKTEPKAVNPCTVGQLTELWSYTKAKGFTSGEVNEICQKIYKVADAKKLTFQECQLFVTTFKNYSKDHILELAESSENNGK